MLVLNVERTTDSSIGGVDKEVMTFNSIEEALVYFDEPIIFFAREDDGSYDVEVYDNYRE